MLTAGRTKKYTNQMHREEENLKPTGRRSYVYFQRKSETENFLLCHSSPLGFLPRGDSP
jgi:hypothetical protein